MEEEKEKLKQKPMMRYIVPFSFSDGYEKVYSKMMSHEDWELENISGQGRHIYNHIYKTIHYAKEEQNDKPLSVEPIKDETKKDSMLRIKDARPLSADTAGRNDTKRNHTRSIPVKQRIPIHGMGAQTSGSKK